MAFWRWRCLVSDCLLHGRLMPQPVALPPWRLCLPLFPLLRLLVRPLVFRPARPLGQGERHPHLLEQAANLV